MKITRTSAFLFILLAYCTMLVHAFVPHHHHDSGMYLVKGEFRHDECCETHTPLSGHSTEDEHQHEDKCGLQLPIVLRANEDETGSDKCAIQDLTDSYYYIIDVATEITTSNSLYYSLKPSIPSFYSGFLPGSESLRGPPALV